MKILVVDDEQDLCEILQYNLELEGYEVTTANSAEEALGLPLSDFSLILLDVMMGRMSGFQLAHQLKENPATKHVPIVFMTALGDEDNTVMGLNMGADDYISKPLSVKEVKARVAAVLRRANLSVPFRMPFEGNTGVNTIAHEGVTLDMDVKTATLDGVELPLTKLEFELLALFLRHPQKVFSREDLLAYCWPKDVCMTNRTVDVSITRLRKKMGRYGKQIKTRVGYGYYFEK